MTESERIQKDIERLENYGSSKGNIVPEKATYFVVKETDGKLAIMGDTNTPDKSVALKKADELAIGNGSDYLVAKIISRHKKRIFTDVINYE